jgi:anti-anti-sigma factor
MVDIQGLETGKNTMEQNIVGNVTIVSIVPRFDSESAASVETELKKILGSGVQNVVCDMKDTDYVASAGLRVLLSTAKTIQRQGGKFAISSIRPKVKEVFDIAGFSQIFSIYRSSEEAVAAIAS